MAVFQLPGTAGLPLDKADGRIVTVHVGAELPDGGDNLLGNGPVGVVGNAVDKRDASLAVNQFQGLADVLPVRTAAAESCYLRFRVHLTDGLCGADEQMCIERIGIQISGPVRLVPHFPQGYFSPVAGDAGLDVPEPAIHNGAVREQFGIKVVPVL